MLLILQNLSVRARNNGTCYRLGLRAYARTAAAEPAVVKTVQSAAYRRKESPAKEIVVNTKYDKCSDPMYRHLVYSSELDVFLTARRGKVWLERMYARNLAAEREMQDRQAAAAEPPVPIALQYLYGGSVVVQGDSAKRVSDEEIIEAETSSAANLSFPYSIHQPINEEQVRPLFSTEDSNTESTSERPVGRRRRSTRRREQMTSTEGGAADGAASSPEYESLRRDLESEEIRQAFTEDHQFKYGTPNPSLPPTEVACGGCGAILHARAENIPGYLPSQLLEKKSSDEIRRLICQRCYIIKEYNIALKVSVSPEDYPQTIEHLKDKEALILLVVDLLDFPGSVWPGILDLLGKKKKIILVGNKADLLMPDQARYLKHITTVMQEEFLKKCFESSNQSKAGVSLAKQSEEAGGGQADDQSGNGGKVFPHVISSICVSARTGLNLEVLIEKIFHYWKWNNSSLPGDIYIIGCTNVGKSSLFNLLLESDLCKVRALDLVQKAITSPVPGTTLNLLKFPVTRPEPHFIADRAVRMRAANIDFARQEAERLVQLRQQSRNPEFAVPSHFNIVHTLNHVLKERQPESGYLGGMDIFQGKNVKLPERLDPASQFFSDGKWCFDSPGTVSQDQIINILTAEEITKTLPAVPIMPRTMLFRVGHSLLLGGLGRLDYVEGLHLPPILITVFCSESLPVNVVETEGVEEFLANAAQTKLTAVPQGGEERMRLFPPLRGQEVTVTGAGPKEGARDIVLSSSGWVMVTGRHDQICRFLAFTPEGKGIWLRKSFLPYAVNLKGKRIQGSPAYRSDRLYLESLQLKGR